MSSSLPELAEQPKKKKPLPFKRAASRQTPANPTTDAPSAAGDSDLEFWSRSKDFFSTSIHEESDSDQDARIRVSPPDNHHRKRRKVSPESVKRQNREHTPFSTEESTARAKQTLTLGESDDDPILGIKGKGKEIIKPNKQLTPRKSTSATSSKPSIVFLNDDDGGPAELEVKPKKLSPKSSRSVRHSSLDEMLGDRGNFKTESEEEPEIAGWEAKARELTRKTPEATIYVILSSRIPDTKPLIVRRKLHQDMKLVLGTWIETQRNGANLEVPPDVADKLVLTWKGNKIYQHSTAASLGAQVDAHGKLIGSVGEGYTTSGGSKTLLLHLEVWTEETYTEYQEKRERERGLKLGTVDEDPFKFDIGPDEASSTREKQKGIKVVLKAKTHEPLKMSVHSDTTVGSLVTAFRKNRGVGPEQDIAIYFDGESLDKDSLVVSADIDPDETNQLEVHLK
ncbi:hypothetical protein B0T26DRAFT_751896 [Lasiosphaeria miniovina]|uniref:Ubiquitin-like domain-containing protein n=1 Tax=Lasiosphaeria miniovina TaxID=1954250 RepID=A0AA40ALA0_9PEZI|nr:uncharacterized protein B0T26DRAFT_751896 [Lasiosphaeria miniovina]KAK0717899.1 hypothetical protein B0T26DRAFT_751896 [Lasiosphaeria miniovina]